VNVPACSLCHEIQRVPPQGPWSLCRFRISSGLYAVQNPAGLAFVHETAIKTTSATVARVLEQFIDW